MNPSCSQEYRLGVRDQYARDMRVLISKNAAFAQRQVVKHLMLDAKDIGGEQHAAELMAAAVIPAQWSGALSCSARADAGPNGAAFNVKLGMDVAHGKARIQRATADVAELFAGAATGMDLELRGEGHRVSDPGRAWQYRLKGSFVQNGAAVSSYSATGGMLLNGATIRTCDLQMTPL
jgi:hypothetical protein